MSRKENCLDNAVMDFFWNNEKRNVLWTGKNYRTTEELKAAIVEYIDYYNTKRTKNKLKGLTPAEYRNQFLINIKISCLKKLVHYKI